MHRSSISSPDQNNIMFATLLQSKLQMSYELLSSFYRNGVYFLLLRRDAATQRRRHLRIVSYMLLQLHSAHSHFVLLIVQARKK